MKFKTNLHCLHEHKSILRYFEEIIPYLDISCFGFFCCFFKWSFVTWMIDRLLLLPVLLSYENVSWFEPWPKQTPAGRLPCVPFILKNMNRVTLSWQISPCPFACLQNPRCDHFSRVRKILQYLMRITQVEEL